MKVLVTGATGCLGRNLVSRLLKENYDVTTTGRNRNIGSELETMGAHFVCANLEDKDKIEFLCKDKKFVFHCGALSSPWGKYRDFYNANVVGTQNIINGCLKNGIQRLVYVSTPSIYFDFREKFSIAENTPLPKSVNHYANTKRLAELEIDKAFQQHNLPVVTIRPRAIFGPYDTAVIPRIMRAADRGKMPLINNGKAIMDITFVDNVVDSLLLCAHAKNSVLGKKYNITNDQPLAFIDLIDKLFKVLKRPLQTKKIPFSVVYSLAYMCELLFSLPFINKEPPFTRYTVGVISIGQTLDINAAKTDLEYKPRISIDEGLNIYGEWLQNHD